MKFFNSKVLKQIARIVLAVPLCLLGLHFFSLGSFGNVIMFMGIYIGSSLILEPLFIHRERK